MKRGSCFLSIACLLLAAPALASYGEKLGSVHFNGSQPDFGRVPQRGRAWIEEDDERGERGKDQELSEFRDSEKEDRQQHAKERVAQKAQAALERGDTKAALQLWQEYGRRYSLQGGGQDRIEVLRHVHAPAKAVLQYLDALDRLEGENTEWNGALATFAALAADTSQPRWLREHALYQRAAGLAQWLNYRKALLLWQEQLRRFPEGEKREAALLMIARAAVLHNALSDQGATGKAATEQLLRSFPNTRFRRAAQGLRARAELEQGHYKQAAERYCALADGDSITIVRERAGRLHDPHLVTLQLMAYLKALNSATTWHNYRFASKGVNSSLAAMKPAAGKAFLDYLTRDASIAVPYIYYRLYHCGNTPADLTRLASLADRIAQRQILPPLVRVRLAEIYYQNVAYTKSVSWASTAVHDPDPRVRARALYVRAGCRYRRCQFGSARVDLEQLLARCPQSPLRHGARELLALCAEGEGDFPTALDEYFAIDYRDDFAYLIDCRMPIATLENYWQTHRSHRDLLAYSIALRHLRLEHWDDARRWLDHVPTRAYGEFVGPTSDSADDSFARDGADPKKVLANLSLLWRTAERANGSEAKASARYAYARAYYTQGLLQLYNAPLWQGDRMWDFAMWWNGAVATVADDKAVQRYMYQHEVYSHTSQICQELAAQYPHTSMAPYALYRAACAEERLSNLNSWWRTDEPGKWLAWRRGTTHPRRQRPLRDHSQEASRLMERLVHRYPKHPLAKPARKYSGVFYGTGKVEEP